MFLKKAGCGTVGVGKSYIYLHKLYIALIWKNPKTSEFEFAETEKIKTDFYFY